jgi:hypothetical protein
MLLHEQACGRIMAEVPQCAIMPLALAAPNDIGVCVVLARACWPKTTKTGQCCTLFHRKLSERLINAHLLREE